MTRHKTTIKTCPKRLSKSLRHSFYRNMTKIINPHHSLKTFTLQQELTKALEVKYHIRDVFVEVEKEFLVAVIQKC